jgi:L-ascorbate metabolism protein UlaG (beta-lactamase superfamily)
MDIRYLGHATFELSDGDTRVLIDPFLTGNPKAAVEAGELEPTHIFITHGHADHIGDTVDIAKRTGATVLEVTHYPGGVKGTESGYIALLDYLVNSIAKSLPGAGKSSSSR